MFELKQSQYIEWKNETLAATIDFPKNLVFGKKYPFIIICHGFIGSKVGVDRLFVKAAEEFTMDGAIVLRFDFAGCGESSGNYGETGLDAFIHQLQAVLDYSINHIEQIDRNNITVLGHSLGGATAVLTAAIDSRIRHLILWSSVAQPYEDIKRIVGTEKVSSLKTGSFIDYMGYQFGEHFFQSLKGFKPLQAATEFKGDVLILHGTGDHDIPVAYAKDYESAFKSRKWGGCLKYEIIGANHTISNYNHFSQLMTITRNWLSGEQAPKCLIG
jgi:uncharacterized protein